MKSTSVEAPIEERAQQGRSLGRLVRRLEPIPDIGYPARTETYFREEIAFCRCGEQINIVLGSNRTIRRDRVRLRYPDDTQGWCAFRCRNCHAEAKPLPNAKVRHAQSPEASAGAFAPPPPKDKF